jgi:hypothetical protein
MNRRNCRFPGSGLREIDICKQAFLDFFIEVMNKFCPDDAKDISLLEVTKFVNEWVDLHFEENN